MSKEKQIEEMAIELSKANCKPSGCGFCYLEYGTLENSCEEYLVYKKMAQTLYNAGYRKQSDNTVEVVRCKDCKYHVDLDGGVKCQRLDGLLMTLPNDYCSYGRRETDG